MILLTASSQQTILVFLKHFTLIWTDCKTYKLYKSVKCPVSGLCVPGYICKMIIKLNQIDRIVFSYKIPLIKPHRFYLDFALINKEFKSNVNKFDESWNICICPHNLIYLNVDTMKDVYLSLSFHHLRTGTCIVSKSEEIAKSEITISKVAEM